MRSLFYDWLMYLVERGGLAAWRHDLVAPVAGRVLEIAAGTGLDFAHYPTNVTVIATEPNLAMLDRARARAADASVPILLAAADAEALPFRSGAFDECVVALGLCTIPSPTAALAEIHRVVRPGGSVRMLEHVRVNRPIVGMLQDVLTPLWRRIAGGCRLNERSVDTLRHAGFRIDHIHRRLHGHVVDVSASRV